MKKAKKFLLVFALILAVLLNIFIVLSPILRPILRRTFSSEYKNCYNLIADDFEAANQNNLFKIENVILRGSYYYDISAVKNKDMTSQDYFDEYIFFTQKLINSMSTDLDNQLLNESVCFSFEFKEGTKKQYVSITAVRKKESEDIKIWAETNVFADYNHVNGFVSDCKIEDTQLTLREVDFTEEEKNTINQQKEKLLFSLEWR